MQASLPIALLLAGFVLQLLCARWLSPVGKGVLATLACGAAFTASLALMPAVLAGQAPLASLLPHWDGPLALSLRVDGLALLFMLMGTFTGFAILLFSVRYMADEPHGTTRFYATMMIFVAGLLLLAGAADMLGAYLAWELIGLCSYSLVGFWYQQTAAVNGARKVLVITHLAGYGFLIGLVLVYQRSGSFGWTDPAVVQAFSAGVAALFIVSAMAKSVMFPLHSWIPEAMNAPTPVSALLHSACYVKAGVYLVARMHAVGDAAWHATLGLPLTVIGCVTILVGVIFAMAQTDLKRLLAFHTVSQLGYIVVGLGIGSDLGLAAALFYCLSHALFKGTLFMCAGAVQHATGTRDLRQLGGLATVMPWTARIWVVAAASIAGVPLTNGFVAKWLLFNSALERDLVPVLLVCWVGSLLTAFSFLKATVNAFYGVPSAALVGRQAHVHEASPAMLTGMGLMAGACLLFGLMPQLMMASVVAPAVHALGRPWDVGLSWLGLLTTKGVLGATVGGAAVLVAALAGATLFRATRASAGARVSAFSGGEPLPAGDRPGAVDFASAAEAAFHPVYSLDPDPLLWGAWARLQRLAQAVQAVGNTTVQRYPLLTCAAMTAVVAAAVWGR